MTGVIAASFMAVLGIGTLALWHAIGWHAERDHRREQSHQLIQAQLDRTHEYPTGYDYDAAYRELRERAEMAPLGYPYDWEHTDADGLFDVAVKQARKEWPTVTADEAYPLSTEARTPIETQPLELLPGETQAERYARLKPGKADL